MVTEVNMRLLRNCVAILFITLLLPISSAGAETAGQAPNIILSKGNGRFAFELFSRINSDNPGQNVLVSPFSISSALAMTYAGARGETEAQMARTLHFAAQDKLHPAFRQVDDTLSGSCRDDCKLYITNALWGQSGYKFKSDFRELVKKFYDGGFRETDFSGDPDGSRITINKAVEDATAGKIKDLLAKDDITELTRLVLTNAVYFKDSWESRFDEGATATAPFYKSPGATVNAQMMHQQGRFMYAKPVDGLQMLELPYSGNALSMVVLLPEHDVDGLASRLNYDDVVRWLKQMHPSEVKVSLPRFKFNARYGLNSVLTDMGMPDAFDDMKADFSGLTGKKGLYITAVIHQADIEVNEEGTEAAAATAVVIGTKSMPMITEFNADRPFVFMILHKATGAILFIGSVKDPA
jgi:serine protease inhibitor